MLFPPFPHLLLATLSNPTARTNLRGATILQAGMTMSTDPSRSHMHAFSLFSLSVFVLVVALHTLDTALQSLHCDPPSLPLTTHPSPSLLSLSPIPSSSSWLGVLPPFLRLSIQVCTPPHTLLLLLSRLSCVASNAVVLRGSNPIAKRNGCNLVFPPCSLQIPTYRRLFL